MKLKAKQKITCNIQKLITSVENKWNVLHTSFSIEN